MGIDAARLKFRQAACLACIGASGCPGTEVCSTATPNTCVAKGADDTTCAAIDAAKPKWSTVSKKCVAAATGDATKKCETILPTDTELAKMCGEGTTFDKAKKKCVTDPTSRCTTNSESAAESAGSAHFVSRTATLTAATVIIVLFYKL